MGAVGSCYLTKLVDRVEQHLALVGFVRRGSTFRKKQCDGNYCRISFREHSSSVTPSGYSLRFSVELTVTSAALSAEFLDFRYFGRKGLTHGDFHLYLTLGSRWSETGFSDWILDSESESDITCLLVSQLKNHAVPFLEEHISDRSLCRYWLTFFEKREHLSSWTLSALAFLLLREGRMDEFERVVNYASEYMARLPSGRVYTVSDYLQEMRFRRSGTSPIIVDVFPDKSCGG